MKEEVIITIDGISLGEAQEQSGTKAAGTYRSINGNHYVHYIEAGEDEEDRTKVTIKLTQTSIEIIKSGAITTKMIFDRAKLTMANYNTPYGSLSFTIHTSLLELKEQPEDIHAELKYTLSSGDNPIIDNHLKIHISSRTNRL